MANSGATALTILDTASGGSGLALPSGATVTFPNSNSGTITVFASATGGTGQVTYYLPD